jgi:hypothetical protein
MSSSTSYPVLTGAATVAALATLLAGCAAPARDQAVPPPATETITIQVSGCQTEHITIAVDHWYARVSRLGRPLRWINPPRGSGVDNVIIEAKGVDWPFADGWEQGPEGRLRRSAGPGEVIQAGPVRPNAPARAYPYRILLRCGGRVIDIDPEVEIFDP